MSRMRKQTKGLNTQRDNEGIGHRRRAQLGVITHNETRRKQKQKH